jgi:hypothetical protein
MQYGLLVTLAALWGGSFVFMRVAVPALGAVPLAYVRVSTCGAGRAARHRVRTAAHSAVSNAVARASRGGIVNSAIPFSLFCYAEQYISASAGRGAERDAPVLRRDRGRGVARAARNRRRSCGIGIGFAGVVTLVGTAARRDEPRRSCCGRGVSRRLDLLRTRGRSTPSARSSDVPSHRDRVREPGVRGAGADAVLPFTAIPGPLTALVVANVLGLAIGSTAIAYLIYFKLIADVGPQRALTVTFLIPLFGVLWGALFLDEPLTLNLLIGGALVVGGTIVTVRAT